MDGILADWVTLRKPGSLASCGLIIRGNKARPDLGEMDMVPILNK